MNTTLSTEKAYLKLVDEISALYEQARDSWGRFAWETGRRIVEVEQKGDVRSAYGSRLIPELSRTLTAKYGGGFSETNLEDMRRFYLASRISRPAGKLPWTTQLALARIEDPRKRKALEDRVLKAGLRRDEVRSLVRQVLGPKGEKGRAPRLPPLERPQDLKFNTFKVAKDEVASAGMVPKGAVLVDCGFYVYRPVQKEDAAGLLTAAPSYTYAGRVVRIVDGDTLVALIDVGFGNRVVEKLRLRGIDTPELGTSEGGKAKKFVEKLLPAGTLVVIKSQKSTDPHGRFVVDVFWKDPSKTLPRPPGDQRGAGAKGVSSAAEDILTSGEYLNQVLLDKGYAVRMEGESIPYGNNILHKEGL